MRTFLFRIQLTISATIFVLCGLPLVALSQQSISPDLVQISTPVYSPGLGDFSPAVGTYLYRVSWQGLPAAEITLDVNESGLYYRVNTKARTFSAIDLFYKLRYKAEGLISAVDFRPRRTNINVKENSREKNVEITFLENGEIRSVREQKGKDTQVLQFNPNNFTLDPFSAAFLARSLEWREGDTKHFDTFNGKSRYLISLTCVEKKPLLLNGVNRDVFVISPKVENLTTINGPKKLREAKIYLTADKQREILKITSEVFIGSVTTKLLSFTPAARQPYMAKAGGGKQLYYE